MHIFYFLFTISITLLQLTEAARNPEKILLSKVKTLTLRKDLKTSHNRVAAVPQVITHDSCQSRMTSPLIALI